MKCIHCGSDCKVNEKSKDLTTAQCLEVVEDLASLGCKIVFISGGEPLLRKDLGAILSAIALSGMKIAFVSNGYLLNEDTIDLISQYRPLVYGISIDAGEAWMHNYIRGIKGSFEHVQNAIKLLQKRKIPPSIVTTLHKLNYNQLPKIREFLIENNVNIWQIQYADNMGRMHKECKITEAQFLESAKFILDTRKNYPDKFKNIGGADVYGYMSEMSQTLQGFWCGCVAGMRVAGLSANGDVRGCLSMQNDKYIEDNVKNRSFKEIWLDKTSFAYNRRFDCNTLTGYCKECLYSTICKGGCMRSASLDGGRCTPYCLYRIEKNGFSSKEEAKISFTKEEIAKLYNPIKQLPEEFYK
jgi:radical SAM protein with 4Fe4S-binding SPASM domain